MPATKGYYVNNREIERYQTLKTNESTGRE